MSSLYTYNKQQFNSDVSFNGITTFNNTSTQITSSGTVGLRGVGGVDISSGGVITIGGTGGVNVNSAISCRDINTNNYNVNFGTGGLTCGSVTSSGGVSTFNNTSTQINSSGLVGISGGTVSISGDVINIGSTIQTSYMTPINTGSTNVLQLNNTGSNNAQLGNSVALSQDGNTMAFGARYYNSSNGYVSVMVRSGTSWTTQITYYGSNYYSGGQMGTSVSLSSDGNTLAVGSPQEGPLFEGAPQGQVRIFFRTGTSWIQQGIVSGNRQYGHSVSLSSDGNTLAAGEPMNSGGYGAVRVYVRSGSSWSQQFYLPFPNPIGIGTGFGYSLGLSSDGNTMAIGAPSEGVYVTATSSYNQYGTVRVYTRSGTSWNLQQIIQGSTSQMIGYTVSISSDGNTIAASTSGAAAYLYFRSGSTWTLQSTTFLNGYYNFAFSSDGNSLLASDSSAAYLFTRTGTTWNTTGVYIGPSIGEIGSGSRYGNPLALSSDGKTRAIGSYKESSYAGAVRVYGAGTIYTSPSKKLYIDGYVGIGTTSPIFPLQISSETAYSSDTYYGWQASGTNGNVSSFMVSMYTSQYVLSRGFIAFSDKRIKDNIVDIDDDQALQTLRLIKPKTYGYIDKLKRGNENVIGFIAQEIKEIIPKAVTITKDYIPNFYTKCTLSATDSSSILLVTSPIDLSWNHLQHNVSGNNVSGNNVSGNNVSGNNVSAPLYNQSINLIGDAIIVSAPLYDQSINLLGNESDDQSGNTYIDASVINVKLYDQSNNEIICKTTSILDKRRFLIDITGSTFLDASGNLVLEKDGDYFLHGQEVDDFNNLDKNAIFTVVTAAVQDIDRIVQAQQVSQTQMSATQQTQESKISALEQQIASLQTQNAAFEARLAAKGF